MNSGHFQGESCPFPTPKRRIFSTGISSRKFMYMYVYIYIYQQQWHPSGHLTVYQWHLSEVLNDPFGLSHDAQGYLLKEMAGRWTQMAGEGS